MGKSIVCANAITVNWFSPRISLWQMLMRPHPEWRIKVNFLLFSGETSSGHVTLALALEVRNAASLCLEELENAFRYPQKNFIFSLQLACYLYICTFHGFVQTCKVVLSLHWRDVDERMMVTVYLTKTHNVRHQIILENLYFWYTVFQQYPTRLNETLIPRDGIQNQLENSEKCAMTV